LKRAILTNSELEWLIGKKKVSKLYEYRLRSDIKKKIQIFQESELPLLAHYGFLHKLSMFTQLSANTQMSTSTGKINSIEKEYPLNITSDLSSVGLYDENNTYKNNQIDKDGRAGGLAWLGYRLDMAGITRSNRVRPTSFILIERLYAKVLQLSDMNCNSERLIW
jgi:hypothetical protein